MKDNNRKSGLVAADRECWKLPGAMPTAGGRLARTARRTTPKSCSVFVMRPSALGATPMAITTAFIITCLIGDDDELAEILQAPLIKAFLLQVPAQILRERGFQHPMGENWRGIQDIDPGVLTRDRIVAMLDRVEPGAILSVVPHGTPKQLAKIIKPYCDAGLRVPKLLDYGGMAGLKYSVLSATKVREAGG